MINTQEQQINQTAEQNAQFFATQDQIDSEYVLQMAKFGAAQPHPYICPNCKTQYSTLEEAKECHRVSVTPNLRIVIPSHSEKVLSNRIAKSGFNVDELEDVEKLALTMLDDSQVESLAINHSILKNENEVKILRNFHWIYYLTFPFAVILSTWVMLQVFWYRIMHWRYKSSSSLVEQERFLLGPAKPLSFFLDAQNPIAYAFRQGVTTSVSLDLGYNFTETNIAKSNKFGDLVTKYWFYLPEAVGSRNRIKMTYANILRALDERRNAGAMSVKILSLACGSAQALIEAIAVYKSLHPSFVVQADLVDLNVSALNRARTLAISRGVESEIRILTENIKIFLNSTNILSKYDIVEMVGFLDYRSTESIIEISMLIKQCLVDNGVYITAMICPRFSSFVLRWCGGWPLMKRRSPKEFSILLKKSGFGDQDAEYQVDPTKTFCVAYCNK